VDVLIKYLGNSAKEQNGAKEYTDATGAAVKALQTAHFSELKREE